MRKIIEISIPIVVLLVFALILLSGSYLKQDVVGVDGDFLAYIKTIEMNIVESQWEEAMANANVLDDIWNKIINRIQFSEERDQMNKIDVNIARLKGAINAKDKINTLIELSEAKMHWKDLGK